jgi:hypothetical protein
MPDRTAGLARLSPPPARPARRFFPSARIVLAVLLLAMAAGQERPRRLRLGPRHLPGVPGRLLTPTAAILTGTEAMAGVTLLGGRRRGGSLALLVTVAWTVLSIEALARGLVLHNCGCFGVHLGQPLRWWVLAEDAEFVALAAWVRAPLPGLGSLTGEGTFNSLLLTSAVPVLPAGRPDLQPGDPGRPTGRGATYSL